MTNFTATFTNGKTLTRKCKSNNGYAFAWMATWISVDGNVIFDSGFSGSFELAAKAAKPFTPFGVWGNMSAKNRAIAKAKNVEFLQSCNLQVEIVPVVAA